MRFTIDYQQHSVPRREPGKVARQLLTIFQEVEQFRLSTMQDTRLDLAELMQYLNSSI